MQNVIRSLILVGLVGGLVAPTSRGAVAPDIAQKLYADVTPSLVAVQYVWQSELGRRELITSGIVVGDDGLVMTPLAAFNIQIPDEQMKEFKIIVPRESEDPQELDAVFQGRDERTNLAFIKTKEPRKWKSIHFEESPVQVGDTVLSVGLLPQAGGYKSYFMETRVAATLRGEVPQVLAQSGLAATGSPVFNARGQAIGIVSFTAGQSLLLNNGPEAMASIQNPPKFFVPARDFLLSFQDPPTPEKPIALPWMGVPQLTGLTKDVAEIFDLKNQPAIQVGEVIHGTPAETAGLKQGDIIVKVNGQPLERGDEAAELPNIFRRQLLRLKPGQSIALSVLRKKDQPLQEIKVQLGEQPKRANLAKRWFADDLGFAVRDVVFIDTYARKLAADARGVIVALTRPQGSAESGGLHHNDLIQRLNGQPVTNVDEFQKSYEALRKDRPREAVVLVVLREGREDTIRIEPPQ